MSNHWQATTLWARCQEPLANCCLGTACSGIHCCSGCRPTTPINQVLHELAWQLLLIFKSCKIKNVHHQCGPEQQLR